MPPLLFLFLFFFFFSFSFLLLLGGSEAATFTIINSCAYTVWPGILSNAGVSPLSTTGFSLSPASSTSLSVPSSWAGRFWARTLCSSNSSSSSSSSSSPFSCLSGDCGSGSVSCSGSGASPPATLAEFTLSGSGGLDFYDVSLVDGYNLPLLVTPRGGSGPNCTLTGCIVDLNAACPSDLRVLSHDDQGGTTTVACRSACDAFNTPEYCCSGAYGSPDTCKPSSYAMVFKKACPRAYSYAYDDKSSTFTCGGSPDYTITLCPSPATSQKASSSEGEGGDASPSSSTSSDPIMNSSMVYEGALDDSSAASTCRYLIAAGIATLMPIWQFI